MKWPSRSPHGFFKRSPHGFFGSGKDKKEIAVEEANAGGGSVFTVELLFEVWIVPADDVVFQPFLVVDHFIERYSWPEGTLTLDDYGKPVYPREPDESTVIPGVVAGEGLGLLLDVVMSSPTGGRTGLKHLHLDNGVTALTSASTYSDVGSVAFGGNVGRHAAAQGENPYTIEGWIGSIQQPGVPQGLSWDGIVLTKEHGDPPGDRLVAYFSHDYVIPTIDDDPDNRYWASWTWTLGLSE